MKTTMAGLMIGVATLVVCGAVAEETDKTLVSWVTLANTTQRGGEAFAMGSIKVPFELAKGEDLNLRVFLDKGMVEVFVNARQAAVYMQLHSKENVGISLLSKGGDIAASVKSWKMKSIYSSQ